MKCREEEEEEAMGWRRPDEGLDQGEHGLDVPGRVHHQKTLQVLLQPGGTRGARVKHCYSVIHPTA